MKHLLVDMSGHGYGHLGQTSAVLNALYACSPSFKTTLRSTLPEQVVAERMQLPFTYIYHELDKGMVMRDAVHTDAEKSLLWYQQRHQDYPALVKSEADKMKIIAPDVLFANIPYISLDVAKSLDIPGIALCSLNWYEILKAYCQDRSGAGPILEQIQSAYAKADRFLQPEPCLAMTNLNNTKSIEAISTHGNPQRDKLLNGFNSCSAGVSGNEKFILVSLGGIPADFCTKSWPAIDSVYWIMPDNIETVRADMLNQNQFDMPFIDLLSSVDLVMTKTGYGTMVEAVVHKKPLICIRRGDWPEEAVLFPWCEKHGHLQVIDYNDVQTGHFASAVNELLSQKWQRSPVSANGAQQAAVIVKDRLNP